MSELPEGFDSIFRYIAVVSQRAEQLISGAKVRSDTRFTKPTMQAKDDVDTGMVDWRVLTQEELDAQRQAIVEQFRAEVGADEYKAIAAPNIQAMLGQHPAIEAEAAVKDEAGEERDDELARLQRLLGLAGPAPSAPSPAAYAEEGEAADDEDEAEDIDDEPMEEELSLEDLEVDVDESFDDEDE